MSTIKKLIKSMYKNFKSDERERKALKREGKLSKKPVDPAEQEYKQKRRIERYERRPYEGDGDTLYDEYESGNRDEAKRYLRKSRRGEISKEDVDDRINHKRSGTYEDMDLDYERKRRKDEKFWRSVNKRLKDKGIDPHVLDDDIPY